MRGSRACFVVCALALTSSCTPPLALPHACPRDAVPRGPGCACLPGLTLLEGACVGASDVAAYCGVPASGPSSAASCEAPVCARGEAIDLVRATCIPSRAVRALTAQEHPLPEDMTLGCHEGSALVVRGIHVSCLPYADTCPRATTWDPSVARCAPSPPCEPGALRASACTPVVARSPGGPPTIDVARWTLAMLGPDGADASPRLCGPLRQRPWDFDVSPGGARTIALSVELVFPDNDVTQVTLRAQALDAVTAAPLGGEAPRAAEAALDSLLVPLRALGGSADAASATLRVTCTIRGGSSPLALPR